MAKKKLSAGITEIAVVIDESGSMGSCRSDVIGGFNTFIKDQRKLDGEARITLTVFNTESRVVYSGKDIHEDGILLTEKSYRPGGGTALFDAVGKTINDVSSRIEDLRESEKPSRVICLIMTDGYENASKEFKPEHIAKRIAEFRKHDWEFLFIGADEKSITEAKSFGVSMARGAGGQSVNATMSVNWGDTDAISTGYLAMNNAVSNYRGTGNVGNWTADVAKEGTDKTVTVHTSTAKSVVPRTTFTPSK
jgi:Mg-chelatase subunit ChlD